MLTILWPVLVMILGLFIWFASEKPKISEAGKLLFFCGALVTTQLLASSSFRIGSGS
jgi:hypothetical protein